jgi:hypothetical protein
LVVQGTRSSTIGPLSGGGGVNESALASKMMTSPPMPLGGRAPVPGTAPVPLSPPNPAPPPSGPPSVWPAPVPPLPVAPAPPPLLPPPPLALDSRPESAEQEGTPTAVARPNAKHARTPIFIPKYYPPQALAGTRLMGRMWLVLLRSMSVSGNTASSLPAPRALAYRGPDAFRAPRRRANARGSRRSGRV